MPNWCVQSDRLREAGMKLLVFAACVLNISAAKAYLAKQYADDGYLYDDAEELIERGRKSKTKTVAIIAIGMMLLGGLVRYAVGAGVVGLMGALVSYLGLLLIAMHMYSPGSRQNLPSLADMFKRKR